MSLSKIAQFLKKGGNIPKMSCDLNENDIVRFSIPENPTVDMPTSYVEKFGILHFWTKERSRMRVYLFFFFFFKYICHSGDQQ